MRKHSAPYSGNIPSKLAEITQANGMTMLHQAVCHGALLITKWLLDHGADVNCKAALSLYHGGTFLPNSPQGWTPLDFAATGHGGDWLFDTPEFERIAKVLLDHGAYLTTASACRGTLERCINAAEAAVVLDIYQRYAKGDGFKQIAHALNAQGVPSPRPQRGRPAGWAPGTIRAVLRRPIYRGVLVWDILTIKDSYKRVAKRLKSDGYGRYYRSQFVLIRNLDKQDA